MISASASYTQLVGEAWGCLLFDTVHENEIVDAVVSYFLEQLACTSTASDEHEFILKLASAKMIMCHLARVEKGKQVATALAVNLRNYSIPLPTKLA